MNSKVIAGITVIAMLIWLGFYNWQLSIWLMVFFSMVNSGNASNNTKILKIWGNKDANS